MKKTISLIIIISIISSISYISAQNKGNSVAANVQSDGLYNEAKTAINNGNTLWSRGWKNRDAALVASIFMEDGTQLSLSGKVFKGKQRIMEVQNNAMKGVDPGVKVTITTTNLWLDGETAYETGKYKYEYKDKGSLLLTRDIYDHMEKTKQRKLETLS